MRFTCKYCGKKIDPRKTEKYQRKICDKPLLYEVRATCKHCHKQQMITVMDTLQKHYADQYGRVLQEMNDSGRFFDHPACYVRLLKQKTDLEVSIQHRHAVLMERLEKLRKEGLLIDGK